MAFTTNFTAGQSVTISGGVNTTLPTYSSTQTFKYNSESYILAANNAYTNIATLTASENKTLYITAMTITTNGGVGQQGYVELYDVTNSVSLYKVTGTLDQAPPVINFIYPIKASSTGSTIALRIYNKGGSDFRATGSLIGFEE